jgi:ferredoxin
MAEKVNERDIYDDLKDYYISLRQPVPNFKQVRELLETIFSPEEAQLALLLPHLSQGGLTLAQAAEKAGKGQEEIGKRLEDMAHKGVVFVTGCAPGKEKQYSLWDFGRIPMLYDPNRKDPATQKIKELREKMWTSGWSLMTLPGSSYPLPKIIPYEQGMTDSSDMHPSEKVSQIVQKPWKLATANCPCRVTFEKCDKPIFNCIQFNDMAEYFIHYHGGKEITPEECQQIVEDSVKEGLVTTLLNHQELTYGFCLCDPCCCVILRPYIEDHNIHCLAKSNYRPQFDEEKCTRCQQCKKICPLEAIRYFPGCIGCGVCTSACKFEALTLNRVSNIIPVPTVQEAREKFVQGKMW